MNYDIYISHDTEDIFFVRVCNEVGTETVHRVTVSGEAVRQLGLGTTGTNSILQHAFLFLLERESPQAIKEEFALMEINDYYPEFEQEIKGRVAIK